MSKTRLLSIYHPEAIQIAKTVLLNGGLSAFPTDTVYGLSALVTNPVSIDKLYQAKTRDQAKAIPVLIGSLNQLPKVTSNISSAANKLVAHFWPGALTIIFQKNLYLPDNLSQTPTIGVRMPNHPFALQLLKNTGPLATTSANLSGQENPQTAAYVLDQLGDLIDLVLDGGSTPGNIPSTVVDCTGSEIRLLRQGAIPFDMIQLKLCQSNLKT